LANLYAGDLVVEVDGQAVGNVDALRQALEKIAAARKPAVVMKVMRGIHSIYLEFEPNWKH
jgi:S1-C subfamily serine protease